VNAAPSSDLDAQFPQALADGVLLSVLDVLWQGIGEIGAKSPPDSTPSNGRSPPWSRRSGRSMRAGGLGELPTSVFNKWCIDADHFGKQKSPTSISLTTVPLGSNGDAV